ncbi:hypothetical protein GGE65_006863 [Skermanella aerolata]|uniref:Uncharacterized protein n=1 Tax=Skermanella aerolata TaxID=393310 RepID=A0A512DS73_9PROT|nr:hypothetical protein [Skermanella aerolata]KJB92512.1 hypothetical protein N826_22325 [Skermanella aerolata KACC 11604]GEO39060.1 hypothetical protein SAE02_32080 [Skermanella aerolata]
MRELRCIVFTERELISAVIGRRRKRNEELPQGTVESVKFRTGDTIETIMEVKDDYGRITSLHLPEPEVAAALIAFCMGRKIPLPVEAEKTLHVIKDAATLIITMNFNKNPRLVGAGPEKKARRVGAGRDLAGSLF